MEKLKTVDPQYEPNGTRGIWILKPSDLCCGTGIVISHDLGDILRRIEEKPKDYFIVQKYIGTGRTGRGEGEGERDALSPNSLQVSSNSSELIAPRVFQSVHC